MEYEHVDTANVNLTDEILPTRDSGGTWYPLRLEDIAFITEGIWERSFGLDWSITIPERVPTKVYDVTRLNVMNDLGRMMRRFVFQEYPLETPALDKSQAIEPTYVFNDYRIDQYLDSRSYPEDILALYQGCTLSSCSRSDISNYPYVCDDVRRLFYDLKTSDRMTYPVSFKCHYDGVATTATGVQTPIDTEVELFNSFETRLIHSYQLTWNYDYTTGKYKRTKSFAECSISLNVPKATSVIALVVKNLRFGATTQQGSMMVKAIPMQKNGDAWTFSNANNPFTISYNEDLCRQCGHDPSLYPADSTSSEPSGYPSLYVTEGGILPVCVFDWNTNVSNIEEWTWTPS